VFADRASAGRALAGRLARDGYGCTAVVGLARGGVVVAAALAESSNLPLDALAVRKIRHPLQPEYAIGALTARGPAYLRPAADLDDSEIEVAVRDARAAAVALDSRLHGERPELDLRGQTVVLVDDGLATGATMIAAVRHARAAGAAAAIAAAPVSSTSAARDVGEEADGLVCVRVERAFFSVGFWYATFDQVDEETVLRLLRAR